MISSEPEGPPLTLNQMIADIATKPSTRLRSCCTGSSGLSSPARLAVVTAAPGAAAGTLGLEARSLLRDPPISGSASAPQQMVAHHEQHDAAHIYL